jgi:hypothetical protein
VDDAVARGAQLPLEELVGGALVVDHQHRAAAAAVSSRAGLRLRRGVRRPRAVGREDDGEGRAPAGLALDRDVAAEHAAEVPGDGQTEPGPAVVPGGRRVRLAERLEQPRHLLRRHADPGVGDPELQPVPVPAGEPSGLERDPAPLGELGGVAEQVEQGLADLDLVRAHRAEVGRVAHLERVAVPRHQRLDRLADVLEHGGDVELLDEQVHLAGLDLRQVEDVVDQAEQVPARAADLSTSGLSPSCPRSSASSSRISL